MAKTNVHRAQDRAVTLRHVEAAYRRAAYWAQRGNTLRAQRADVDAQRWEARLAGKEQPR